MTFRAEGLVPRRSYKDRKFSEKLEGGIEKGEASSYLEVGLEPSFVLERLEVRQDLALDGFLIYMSR
jgi:hypothetical protein